MKQLDKRGFSLVELIIAVAILGLLLLAVGGFMVSGARAYSSVSARVSLQTKSQMLLNQIREHSIDCTDGIGYSDAEGLQIKNGDVVSRFYLDTADGANTLYYQRAEETPQVVSSDVTAFSAALPAGTPRAASVVVTVTLERAGKRHTEAETVALRNDPPILTAP